MTAIAADARPSLPKLGRRGTRVLRGAIGVVVLLAIVEAGSLLGIVPATVLPPASRVLAATASLLVDPVFLGDVWATVLAWAAGLGIAAVVGVSLGLVLGSFRLANEAASAAIEFLRPIPSVALIPVAILVFGQDADMKIALAVYASIWPILFNTIYGVRDVDPIAKETARTFRLSRVEILTRVSLPSAAPFAATGIRISAAIALIVTISAELLAGSADGIGSFILRTSSGGGDTALVFAGTVIAGLLGVLVNVLLEGAERLAFRWKTDGVPA
jgi:NitT/TauT family transport system permease protein